MPQTQRTQYTSTEPTDDIRRCLQRAYIVSEEPGILDWLEDQEGQTAASRGADLNERLFVVSRNADERGA